MAPIDIDDFMADIVAGIDERDHKVVVVDASEGISEEMSAQTEADGYVFTYSSAPEDGRRKIYSVRQQRPAPRT
jgi:hypothetical protein